MRTVKSASLICIKLGTWEEIFSIKDGLSYVSVFRLPPESVSPKMQPLLFKEMLYIVFFVVVFKDQPESVTQ